MTLIPLTQGLAARVSDQDREAVLCLRWRVRRNKGGTPYAAAGYNFAMHRMILERKLGRALVEGEEADHRNGDTLDNQRGNLRLATNSQNASNRPADANARSEFKGVSWHSASASWEVRICAKGKKHHLGYFHNEQHAARAYDLAARKLHGRFARLNFP
jgi:hypothetical protein